MLLLADYLLTEHTRPGEMRLPVAENRGAQLLRRAQAAFVAPPHVWPGEIMNVVAELPLPRHVISPRILPAPRSWHAFSPEIAMGIRDPEKHEWLADRNYGISACLLEDGGQDFLVTSFIRHWVDGELRLAVDAKRFRYGMTYPDDFGDDAREASKTDAELVLSMLAFLNSPYIPKQKLRPNRTVRRQLGLGAADAVPETTFVLLRRPATRKPSGDEPPSTVDWKHRWVVSGHYRAQWYPSEQAHRVIWIAPYVKGPDDAPLIDHVYKVAR